MTTVRALLALTMLAGFYVLAIGMVVALGFATVWAFTEHASAGAGKLGVATIVLASSIVLALWRVARAERTEPGGVPVTPASAPDLWRMVHEIADIAQTRAPDEILLVMEPNAAVMEETRLMGLVGGRRTMVVGVPLLQGLSRGQLRSVLAHELGHYSNSHTKLGPLTYRGRETIVTTVQHLDGNLMGWLLAQWGKLYVLVAAAVSRAQEREADVLSATVAGKETARSALREVSILDAAWNHYVEQYVTMGWSDGLAPEPAALSSGFADLLAARATELDELRAQDPEAVKSVWDSHPPIPERIAAIGALSVPEVGAPLLDARPATGLLPTLATDSERLAAEQVGYEDRTRLPWDRLVATALPIHDQRLADLLYRAAARVAGTPRAGLDTVVSLVAAGRYDQIHHALLPQAPADADEEIRITVEAALRMAALRCDTASWRLSWSGQARFVRPDGTDLDLAPLAARALDPATAPRVRDELLDLGIDLDGGIQVSTRVDVRRTEYLGGLANVRVDRVNHDLLLLDTGILLVPGRRFQSGRPSRLVKIVTSMSAPQAAATYPLISFEEIRRVRVLRKWPVRLLITLHDGRTVQLHHSAVADSLTPDSRKLLLAGLAPATDR